MDEKVNEVKNTIIDFIININMRIDDISNGYRNKNNMDNERLVNLFEDLQALSEGIEAIKGYYNSIDLLDFQEKIDMMERAMSEMDMVLLIDIMQYELKSLLEYWKDCLS